MSIQTNKELKIMLTILRKYKENIVIKIILGFIALAFILFFGSSNLQQNNAPANVPAKVNGKNINGLKTNYLLNNQMEQLRNVFKDKVPEDFVNNMKASVINALINQELTNQELKKMGLQTTNLELAESIKKNSQFYRDGKFDIEYYNERFLPGYQLATGTSFEQEMMDEILTQKFFGTFDNLLELNSNEVQKIYQIENTKFKFALIKIKKDDQGKDIAQKVWDAWKRNYNVESVLTEQKLKKTETGELGYTDLKSIFGGKVSPDNVKTLLSLSEKNPFPETFIEEGNNYYLVKFLDMKLPSKQADESSLAKTREDFAKNLNDTLKSSFISELRKTAKIRIYP